VGKLKVSETIRGDCYRELIE